MTRSVPTLHLATLQALVRFGSASRCEDRLPTAPDANPPPVMLLDDLSGLKSVAYQIDRLAITGPTIGLRTTVGGGCDEVFYDLSVGSYGQEDARSSSTSTRTAQEPGTRIRSATNSEEQPIVPLRRLDGLCAESGMPTEPFDENPFDIVALGGNAVDRIVTLPDHPSPGEKVEVRRWVAQGGGRAATAMVVPARLGMQVRLLSAVGDDPEGRESLESLRAEGIDTSGVRVRPGAMTQRAFILVDEKTGERTILWGRGDEIPLEPGEVDETAIRSGRLFFTDAQNPRTSAKAAQAAKAAAIPVVADLEHVRPGLDDLLPHLDVLITSADFPEAATGTDDLAAAMSDLANRSRGGRVIVTRGKLGATALIDGALRTFPAYAVEALDTTGAGDVFHGAFTAAMILDLNLCDALDFSNAVAAMKCRELGGRSGIPRSVEEIERFRRETDHRAGAIR